MSVFKTAAIFAKSSPDLKGPLEALAALVTQSGVSLLVDETASQILADPVRFPPNSVQTIGEKADVAIVLGGDGTTLGIGRRLAQYDCPIIGINAGRLGFITDVVLEEMSRVIPLMLEGHYVRDPRPIIEGSVLHEGRVVYQSNAVNDIGITHGKIGGMVEYTIYVNGLQMSSQRADGIIYATTTGSTAYALAAGGPILYPSLKGVVLVPVAPHTLSNRPIVLPSDAQIDIKLTEVKDGQAYFDMQEFMPMEAGDVLHIHVGHNHFTLLHPAGYNHFDLLRRKLKWNLMPTSSRIIRYPSGNL